MLSVWKPLNGPVRDWPLALCDISSIDASKDLEETDFVYQNHVEEDSQMYHRSHHKWYYQNEMTPSQAYVFRQHEANSALQALGVPHTSFECSYSSENETLRESIEVQTLMWWD